MNSLSTMNRISIVLSMALASGMSAHAGAPGGVSGAFANAPDYSYMNWVDGLRDPNFRIQTSRYVLNYHHPSFGPTALAPLANAPSEERALTADLDPGPPVSLKCGVIANGTAHPAGAASDDMRTSQIVESGKFFNRRLADRRRSGRPGLRCGEHRA